MYNLKPQLTIKLLQSERGFLLVASLLITAIIVTLGAAVSFTVMNNQLVARNIGQVSSARFEADGGIDAVLAYFSSGEAEIQFDPDPPVPADAGTIFAIDEDRLIDDINLVFQSVGLTDTPNIDILGSDEIACLDTDSVSTVYVNVTSQFSEPGIGTRSTRNATIAINIPCESNELPARPCVGGKGLTFNGKTILDVACEIGGSFNPGNSLFNSDNGLAEIYTDPTLNTCNSNQNYVDDDGNKMPAYCQGNQAARDEMKLAEEIKVVVPTHAQLVTNALTRQLKDELAATGLSLAEYRALNTISVRRNKIDVNSTKNFINTLKAEINAQGGGNQGCTNNTIIEIDSGIPIPSGVNFTNCILITKGEINFNGSASHTDTTFITTSGNMTFNGTHTFYNNSSILSSGGVNINNIPQFAATDTDNVYSPLFSIGSGDININGGFRQDIKSPNGVNVSPVIVSQGGITFNGSTKSAATLVTAGNITFNGKSGVEGSVKSAGTLRFNGGPLVGLQSKEEWAIALNQQANEILYGPDGGASIVKFAPQAELDVDDIPAIVITRQ